METLTYILKSTAILGIFYVIYILVLRRDTFFTANRHYLIGGVLAALLLPFVAFETITYIPAPVVEKLPFIVDNTDAQWEALAPTVTEFTIDWFQVLLVIYSIGVAIMMIRFLFQLWSLQRLINSGTIITKNRFTYIAVSQNVTPFSFFKYIVYNPKLHTREEQEMILAHEQVHASQLHSIDVLITQIALALQWCNPIAWLYKNTIEQNLEYIADSTAAQQVQSHKEYQRTLVKVSSTTYRPALTTNFYHSFIKKRIVMLNKPASQRRNLLKLGLILPALALFMYSFHTKEVIQFENVQEDTSAFAKAEPTNTLNVTIKKDFILDDFNEITVDLFTKGIVFITNNVIRNENGTIASMQVITHPADGVKQNRHTLVEKTPGKGIEDATLTFDSETLEATLTTGISTVDTFSIKEDGTITHYRPETMRPSIFVVDRTTTAKVLDEMEALVASEYPRTQFIFDNRSFNSEGQLTKFSFKTKFSSQDDFFTRFTRDATPPKTWAGYTIQVNPNDEILVKENGPKGVSLKITDEIISFLEGGQISTNQSGPIVRNTQDTYRFKITKNTTVEELKALKKMLKEKHKATLDYSNVDFNAQNEITSIQLTFKDANGNSKNYSTSGESPISDIFIYRDADGSTGMGNAGSKAEMEEQMTQMRARMDERRAQMDKQSQERREQMENQIEQRKFKMEQQMAAMKEKRAEQRVYKHTHTSPTQTVDIDAGYVKIDAGIYYYATKDGITSYYDNFGNEIAENDALYKELIGAEKEKDIKKISGALNADSSDNRRYGSFTDEMFGDKKPLVVLDGKVIHYDTMNTLDPNHIGHMNILKGEEALVSYGESAKYGAIEITTKNNPKYAKIKKIAPSKNQFTVDASGQKLFLIQSDTGIKSNANFGGVTQAKIDKNSTDRDIDNLRAAFQKDNITVQKTTVSRNAKGEITQITLIMVGTSGNRTSSTFGNKKKPIGTIWLGYTGNQ